MPRCQVESSRMMHSDRKFSSLPLSVSNWASIASSALASVARRSSFRRLSFSASSVARGWSFVRKSSTTSLAMSIRPAALIRGARRKPTSVAVGARFDGICATCMRARRPGWTGLRSSRRPSVAMTRFSPSRGTESAMVAMATSFKKEGIRLRLRRRRCASGSSVVSAADSSNA